MTVYLNVASSCCAAVPAATYIGCCAAGDQAILAVLSISFTRILKSLQMEIIKLDKTQIDGFTTEFMP